MALPEALRGTRWTERTARKMVPLLVWCAERERTIEYGQMDAELQRRGGHHVFLPEYGSPAGAIGDALIETSKRLREDIPPLNALLVNKSGVPGSGCDYYLSGYVDKKRRTNLNEEQRRSMAEETAKDIYAFGRWEKILDEYGLMPETRGIPALTQEGPAIIPRKGGWSTAPESEAHRALKVWVAKNPQILGSTIPFRSGKIEWPFASADCADVMFEHTKGRIAVEVKASAANEAELERGIYQCVKYQALLRAELKAERKIPNGRAILVTERQPPLRPRKLAKLLGVRVIVVRR
jgi:hypothetical protein